MLILDQLHKADRRLQILAAVVLAGMVALLVGLWYVQIASARRFQASLESQTFRTVRIPATRGKIHDRNGLPLAENRPSYNLQIYLDELRPQFDREFTLRRAGRRLSRAARDQLRAEVRYGVLKRTIEGLSRVLGEPIEVTEAEYRRHHNQWPYRPLIVRENLSPSQIARFMEQAPPLPGVDLEVQPVRYYPQGPLVAHLLGKLSRDDLVRDEEEAEFSYSLPSYAGELGLEFAFNRELAGRPGVKSVTVNSLCYRESETIWASAEPGQRLVLTIDLPIQQAAFNALGAAGPGTRGAVVVLDAVTGDVLALVSRPAYDPNEFVRPLSHERWETLNDPQLRPMFNRATQGAYHPGSTFKIVTALACLEADLDPTDTFRVESDPARPGRGAVYVGRRKIEDQAPPGEYDFVRAFKRSSNSYFIHHGLRAGQDRILRMGRRFRLGEPIGLPTRQEVKGYFPEPGEVRRLWTAGNLANVCIGQEITVTPLQMAIVTAAVANGGRVLSPRLVAAVEPVEPGWPNQARQEFPVQVRGGLDVDPAHLALIRDAMVADTEEEEGTGFRAFQELDRATGRYRPRLGTFRVGGKTGTAEVETAGGGMDKITWFVAFGSFEQPRFAVVVMVEGGGSGGGTCAPIAREVFAAIQKRLAPPNAAPRQLALHQ